MGKNRCIQTEASLKALWDLPPPQELEPDVIFESITPELLSHQSLARFWEGIQFKQYFFSFSFFFLIRTIFKVFIESVTILLLYFVFWPGGMWDLNSLTRSGTCIGRRSLNHWTARKSLEQYFLVTFLYIRIFSSSLYHPPSTALALE